MGAAIVTAVVLAVVTDGMSLEALIAIGAAEGAFWGGLSAYADRGSFENVMTAAFEGAAIGAAGGALGGLAAGAKWGSKAASTAEDVAAGGAKAARAGNEVGGGGKGVYLDEEIEPGFTPTKSGRIAETKGNSEYGMYGRVRNSGTKAHYGLDFEGEVGDNVYAMFPGKVKGIGLFKKDYGEYSVHIESDIKDICYQVDYGHLSKNLVSKGDWVESGQIIGLMGREGNLKGTIYPTHVHIGIWRNYNGSQGFVLPQYMIPNYNYKP